MTPNRRGPWRVLQILNGVPWQKDTGGGILYAFDLGRHLVARGHHVDFLVATERENERRLDWADVSYSFDTDKRRSPISLYRQARSRLREYDVIHTHSKDGALVAFRLRFARKRPALVATVHNPSPTKRSLFRQSVRRRWERLAARCSDVVCVPSEYSKIAVSEAFGLRVDPIRVIPPGVPDAFLAAEAPRREPLEGRPVRLVSIGRICGQKGFDVLLEALASVRRTRDARLEIIGDGPAAEVESVKQQMRRLGLEDAVRLAGYLPRDEILERLWQADLFVLPSRAESFGMVYAEAQAAGLPVIGTAVGGVPEVIADGVSGRIVSPGDVSAVAEAIEDLLSDPKRLAEMGEAAMQRARGRFSWERSVDRTEEAYEAASGRASR
ncbi:MAG: glycosyltransferase family 4 protein [Planctomycetota bacterium]